VTARVEASRRSRARVAVSVDWRAVSRIGGAVVLAGIIGYLVVLPLIRLQANAFSRGDGFVEAYSDPEFLKTVTYTIGLAIGSLAIALVLGTLLAWASTRLPRRLRSLAMLPVLPITIPTIASVIGWAFLLAPGPGYLNKLLRYLPWWSSDTQGPVNIYSLTWIVLITGFGLTSFVYLFVRSAFVNINAEYLEAAEVCGSSSVGVFFRVTLPLLRPALTYAGGVALLLGLGQFTAPLFLGSNEGVTVLTTEMYRRVTAQPVQFGIAGALGTPLLVVGILIVVAQRGVLANQKRFVTHSGKAFRSERKPSYLAAAGLILYTIVSTVLPIAGLTIVALSHFWSNTIDPSNFTLDNVRAIFTKSDTSSAIENSVTYALIAVLIALPIGYVVSSILVQGKERFPIVGKLLDFLVTLPLGVPAVLFGIGFLSTYTHDPLVLYGTKWVVILAYVTLMLPFATRMQLAGLLALGNSHQEASRTCGAGLMRTNLRVVLPLMRSSLGGAAALMFVLLTQEFAASVLVRSIHTQVMGTILYDFWSDGSYPGVAAMALIMTAVTAIGVGVALLLGGAKSLGTF
jgi:iron(III) transport system permease protein